jgi:hypothetical protein
MADAAIRDLDLHVARARRAARDGHGFQRFVGGVGAVGLDGHGSARGGETITVRLSMRRKLRC